MVAAAKLKNKRGRQFYVKLALPSKVSFIKKEKARTQRQEEEENKQKSLSNIYTKCKFRWYKRRKEIRSYKHDNDILFSCLSRSLSLCRSLFLLELLLTKVFNLWKLKEEDKKQVDV